MRQSGTKPPTAMQAVIANWSYSTTPLGSTNDFRHRQTSNHTVLLSRLHYLSSLKFIVQILIDKQNPNYIKLCREQQRQRRCRNFSRLWTIRRVRISHSKYLSILPNYFCNNIWFISSGPKTVFFWAPLMKWCLVAAGVKDLSRPAEKLSVSQNVGMSPFFLSLLRFWDFWLRCFVQQL